MTSGLDIGRCNTELAGFATQRPGQCREILLRALKAVLRINRKQAAQKTDVDDPAGRAFLQSRHRRIADRCNETCTHFKQLVELRIRVAKRRFDDQREVGHENIYAAELVVGCLYQLRQLTRIGKTRHVALDALDGSEKLLDAAVGGIDREDRGTVFCQRACRGLTNTAATINYDGVEAVKTLGIAHEYSSEVLLRQLAATRTADSL